MFQRISTIKEIRKTNNKDFGFTLIELLVVILIIAILSAVGIVALLGAIRSGQESAAKTNLNQANSILRAYLAQNGGAAPSTIQSSTTFVQELQKTESDLKFVTSALAGTENTNVISVAYTPATQLLQLAVRSKNGKCFWLRYTPNPTAPNEKSTTRYSYIGTGTYPTSCIPNAPLPAIPNGTYGEIK